jgi:DNA-binding protein HU-beta
MNKTELAKAIVAENSYNITLACAEEMVNSFMSIVKSEVKAGNKVQLIGFGTFEAGKRAERKGKNPKTGEELIIPACTVPKFKAGKDFKNSLN